MVGSSGSVLSDSLTPEEGLPFPGPLESSSVQSLDAASQAGSVELELVGRWPYGSAGAVAHGEVGGAPYVFLGSGGGVLIVDVDEPSSTTTIGQVVTPGLVRGLTLSGELLLVADYEAGLRIIDTSEPSAPVEVGFLDTPGEAEDVAVSGDLALVADGDSGLRIIDISDPSAPVEVGFLDTPGEAEDVAVSGDLALVADHEAGLRVIDISEPSAPAEVGFLDTPGSSLGVAVSGDLALVADRFGGLRVVDISEPSAPVEVGFLDTPGRAQGVALSGHLALVAGWNWGLRVIDISEPAAPEEVGFLDTRGLTYGVAVSGDLALVADSSRLRLIDISDPSAPAEVGLLDTPGSARGVTVSGDLALVADLSGGLRIIDISDPSAPVEVGFLQTPDRAYGVAVSGDLALVADWDSGLRIIDISEPSAPVEVGFLDTPGEAEDVAVSGHLALVADWSSGLRVIDISEPTTPVEVGFVDTSGPASGVEVSGNLALVAVWSSGLRVIDISESSAPVDVGFLDTPGSPNGVVVSGDLALVADYHAGLAIVRFGAEVVNTPPVAFDQAVVTTADTAVSITLTGSDPDTGDALTFIITSLPESGDLLENPPIVTVPHVLSGDMVTYTPDPGSTGTDGFMFKVNDGTEDSNIATVTINVTDAPQSSPLTVTKTGDSDDGFCGVVDCSLREAIATVDSGDTIAIPAGTYTLTLGSELTINKSLTLTGAGSGDTIIQAAIEPGVANWRVFNIAIGNVTIDGATIRHGNLAGNGSGILNSGTLTLTGSTVSNNSATLYGGGGISNSGILTVENSTITRNSATGEAVAGLRNEGNAALTNTIVSSNTGSLIEPAIVSSNMLVIIDTAIKGNSGGISIGGTLILTNSTITDNRGTGISNSGSAELTRATISNNSTTSDGGGVSNSPSGLITLADSTISGNSAEQGGGIYNYGTLAVTNSTISGNTATRGGGALSGINGFGEAVITNSTITGNFASATGDFTGGGIYNHGTLTLTNITLSYNVANNGGGGGIDNVPGGTIMLTNSIIARNSAPTSPDCSGRLHSSLGHNLIGNDSGCTFTTSTGDLVNVDPLLGPLQDNGGPTATRALRPNSPAKDAGNDAVCPETDQRGVSRPQERACDIGAYEFADPAMGEWQALGPDGGLILTLATSPGYTGDETIFAGTQKGLFRSVNSGNTWHLIGSSLRDRSIDHVVLSPSFEVDSTMFAGTSRTGVLRSTDGGNNWEAKREGLPTFAIVEDMVISPAFEIDGTLFAALQQGGVFRSTNSGDSWEQINPELRYPYASSVGISPDFARDNTVFAGTDDGLFRSRDRGETWELVAASLINVLHLAFSRDFESDQTIFAALPRDGVYRSSDGGDSWQQVSEGLDFNGITELVISPDFNVDHTLFATTFSYPTGVPGSVFQSTNSGDTWERVSHALVDTEFWSLSISPGFESDNTIFVGSNRRVYQSTDRGEIWQQTNEGIAAAVASGLVASPAFARDSTLFVAIQSGGLDRSTDGGIRWTHAHEGLPTSVYASSGPHHQDSGEAKIRESTAGVSRKPSSDCKACGCSSKHLCGLTAWNT